MTKKDILNKLKGDVSEDTEVTSEQLRRARQTLAEGSRKIMPGHILAEDYKQANQLGVSVTDLIPSGEVRDRPLGSTQRKNIASDILKRIIFLRNNQ
jgi:hypothetical protein